MDRFMDQQSRANHAEVVLACVGVVRALEQELVTATGAIARHKLADLEDSLWRQESLCARLKRELPIIHLSMPDDASRACLREAATELKAQLQVYERLVTQSSRSTVILQQLCCLYQNAARRPGRALHRGISREA